MILARRKNNRAIFSGKINNYSDDIEIVWTYLYYSSEQVRIVVGGNDVKRYPEINCIITHPYQTLDDALLVFWRILRNFYQTQGDEPSEAYKDFISQPVVGKPKGTRETDDYENKLPVENANA
ncbi:hypothetical protein pb186bvf_005331 [Paramecium bursaria]